eukprot:scaffold581595_cov43-Prasinocladus_malaysianus.AAC.2
MYISLEDTSPWSLQKAMMDPVNVRAPMNVPAHTEILWTMSSMCSSSADAKPMIDVQAAARPTNE